MAVQSAGPAAGRTQNFSTGMLGDRTAGPISFKPNSVLQQYMPSANGMSATDARRLTPQGMLPSMNGSATDTYNKQNPDTYSTRLAI